MSDASDTLEAIKILGDWAKWLITIETAVTAAVGTLFAAGGTTSGLAKIFGTATVGSFLISIAAAALLLMTLPEITQNLDPAENVWLTRDSVAGRLLRINSQSLALIESIFFGLGLSSATAMTVVIIWV